MADYTKYVLFFMKLNNLKPDQVEVKGSDKWKNKLRLNG
jgi:hypothetical protein